MWYALTAVFGFVIGVIVAYFKIRATSLGTLYIREKISDTDDAEQSYAYIKFNDDPATFLTEQFVTLEVKTVSQK